MCAVLNGGLDQSLSFFSIIVLYFFLMSDFLFDFHMFKITCISQLDLRMVMRLILLPCDNV